jgi:thymidine kinase
MLAAAHAESHLGSIELIIGPMFCGKTTEMLSRVRRAAMARTPSVVVKFSGDVRYDAGNLDGPAVCTHADTRQVTTPKTNMSEPIRVVAASALADVEPELSEIVIGVDEGQFYPDLVAACTKWASEGRRVIVAALDGDFARRPFGEVCNLVPLCESVSKQNGVCMVCRSRSSAFTQRIGTSTALVDIGTCDKYRAVCRACYGALALVSATPP